MKLLFVLRSLVDFGGIERVMSDKMNFLVQQGHDVLLVTYEQSGQALSYPLEETVKHQDLDCRYYTVYQYSILKRLVKIRQLKHLFKQRFNQLVAKEHPDAIVIVSNAGEFMKEVMTAPYGKKVVEAHGAFPAIMAGETWKTKIKAKQILNSIKKSDLLISLTSADAEYWKYYVPKVTNIPNPVTFYIENPDVSLKQNGRIICVGRLHEQKRIDRLIDAFSMIANNYPSWYIDVYGTGEKKAELEKQIEQSGLIHRIHLLEPTRQIKEEYLKSQFFVLSSDYEGMPLVLLEAMACGVPCVSTRCPFGPSELIEDGETGLLTNLDSHDLASKMEWMIVHNKERNIMGVKAHQAAAHYKKENVMRMWEKAYLSVLQE